jgi:hypothetical protein
MRGRWRIEGRPLWFKGLRWRNDSWRLSGRGKRSKSKGEASGGRVEIETDHDSTAVMEARLRFWSIQEVWRSSEERVALTES